MVVDFSHLNKFVRRPAHPFPCPRDVLKLVQPTSKYFAVLDAVQGYFQIPLYDASKALTTFMLPSGRYQFNRSPMGLNASGDEWCSRSDECLSGIPGLIKIVDDILVQADTHAQCVQRLRQVLRCCQKNGITLSAKKFQLATVVHFAGYVISAEGIIPDPAKQDALEAFPAPRDVSELRSFLGLANQLGMFVPDLSHMTTPLRSLLKKDVAYNWYEMHDKAFKKIKDALTSEMVVRPYDSNKPTELLTDASRLKGLGFALLQRGEKGEPFLIQCGSRSLISAETGYATNELEALAVQWGITECKHYLQGCPLGTCD